jgi:serine/threonine-protein kinase HipA
MVMGEGRNPGEQQLIKLGIEAGLSKALIEESIAQTRVALERWKPLAKEFGINRSTVELISKRLKGKV